MTTPRQMSCPTRARAGRTSSSSNWAHSAISSLARGVRGDPPAPRQRARHRSDQHDLRRLAPNLPVFRRRPDRSATRPPRFRENPPTPAHAGRRQLRPRLRFADLRPVLPLFPAVPAETPARVVRHRLRLFAARPRSRPQRAARHGPPAGPVASGRESPRFRRPICPGATATSPASPCHPISSCWCPAAPRTASPSDGRPNATRPSPPA